MALSLARGGLDLQLLCMKCPTVYMEVGFLSIGKHRGIQSFKWLIGPVFQDFVGLWTVGRRPAAASNAMATPFFSAGRRTC